MKLSPKPSLPRPPRTTPLVSSQGARLMCYGPEWSVGGMPTVLIGTAEPDGDHRDFVMVRLSPATT
jgi:hypothetical protein